jgi:hypothetical protein
MLSATTGSLLTSLLGMSSASLQEDAPSCASDRVTSLNIR